MVDDVERGSDSYTSTIEAGTAHKRGGAVPQKHEQSQYSKTDKLDASNIGRAAAARALRLLRRRGNLLAVLVFGTCLFIFFGALAGVGYIDPEKEPSRDPDFVVGGPVFDPSEAQRRLEQEMEAQREREMAWMRRGRPNAGAWMTKQRNAGAVRMKDLEREEGLGMGEDDLGEHKERRAKPMREAPVPIIDEAEPNIVELSFSDSDDEAAAEIVEELEKPPQPETPAPLDPDEPLFPQDRNDEGEGGTDEADAALAKRNDATLEKHADAAEDPEPAPQRPKPKPKHKPNAHPEIPDHPDALRERD